MPAKDENNFWEYDTNHWFGVLNSSANGLTQAAVNRIVQAKGLHPVRNSSFKKYFFLFLSQFKSPLMLLLIGAVILSGLLGDTSDVIIILFIVVSTGLLSFYQERNAGKVVEKLQSLISIKSTVLREGVQQEIIASNIVSGDILILNAGDLLPADCLLLSSDELYANEASLTGESFPTRKEPGVLPVQTELANRSNCLWEGTNIVSGNATALVIQTGESTLYGQLTKSAARSFETKFEKGIRDFGFFLMKITVTLALFILLVNLLNHKGIIESALFALALAVGMAPELLPAITTIAMSAGAKKLLAKKVIVKKLNSIQNLGEVNLLCTDKTGTITEGKINLAGFTDGLGNESAWVKQLAYWNASMESGYSNPIDEAIKNMESLNFLPAIKMGEVPYDFIRKRISIAVTAGSETLFISKGACSEIFRICSAIRLADDSIVDIDPYRKLLVEKMQEHGANGLRTIAVSYKNFQTETISKELEVNMIFGGFILMQDPVKAGISEIIAQLKQLSVELKIITGDSRNVAASIGRGIGIQEPVIMTGKELFTTSPEALKLLVRKTHIFAEVEPQQKERIIIALKQTYTVAYLGDGINDVSAINAADVGISVENAVDAAREAADFVLLEKDLAVLADGIKEGRKTFANTLKYLYISTGATFGNMCSVAAASLVLPFLPMLPKQILLTNFLTDFPFLAVSTDNVDKQQLVSPGKWDLKLIRKYMIVFGIHSSIFDLITFGTLYYFLKVKEAEFQTGWFVESVISELCIVFIIRTHQHFFKSRPGKYLFIFSALALLGTILFPYLPFAAEIGLSPIPLLNLSAMLSIVVVYILTADLLKVWFFKRFQPV